VEPEHGHPAGGGLERREGERLELRGHDQHVGGPVVAPQSLAIHEAPQLGPPQPRRHGFEASQHLGPHLAIPYHDERGPDTRLLGRRGHEAGYEVHSLPRSEPAHRENQHLVGAYAESLPRLLPLPGLRLPPEPGIHGVVDKIDGPSTEASTEQAPRIPLDRRAHRYERVNPVEEPAQQRRHDGA